ncbi:MAG: copper amine oxidase N-terminal domain-containing protein, partial [Armatimonadota bacterium]
MNRRYSLLFCVCCTIVLAFSAHALDTLRVETVCTDGHLLVPARDVLEDFGAHILWSPATRTVTVQHGNTEIVMQVGYPQALVNGEARQLQVAPVLSECQVFIPLRFVAETLGYEVTYTDGEVDLVSGETIVRRIIPAEGPPRCVLDEATEPAATGEDTDEPP